MALTPQLTVAAKTTTQTGASFNRTHGSRSGLITFDVTVGTTVNLIVELQAQAGNGDWIIWALDDTAITGVAARYLLISPLPQTDVGAGVSKAFVAPLPEVMRFVVTHGNANAATYTVTLDFF